MKKRFFAAAAASVLLLTLTACDPVTVFNSLLTDETQNDPVVESAAAEHRREISDYGYNALQTDEERRVYSIIDVSLQDGGTPRFVINNDGTLDSMGNILEMYKSDHPEVFWIDDNYGYEYVEYPTYTEVNLLLTMRDDELQAARDRLDEAVTAFFEKMDDDLSDYEKELYINDRLSDLCEYDTEAAGKEEVRGNEQNAYGALVDHKAVCEGYTRAFQLLCEKADIDCVPVNGVCDSTQSEMDGNHIWNAVKIDDDWYYVDVTWNDFNPTDSDYQLTDIEKHLYFNITTKQLTRDHTINPAYGESGEADYYNAYVPDCTETKNNYFRRSVPVLEDLDDCGDFLKAFSKAAGKGADTFAFRISDGLDYADTLDEITNDGYAIDWIEYSNDKNDSDHQLSKDSLVYSYEEMNVAAFTFVYE